MSMLDKFPIWAIYLGTLVLVLLAAEIGFRVGIWLQRRKPSSEIVSISGPIVGGMLGLMAFLLAFCIGIVLGQHNERKAMVVTEANAVGTAYLRTSFLDEADRTASRDLLREYVEIRLAAASDPSLYDSARIRSEEIHNELWSIVEKIADQGQESEFKALYVESINEVIDVHSLRLAAINLRLPVQLGIMLYASTILSFLLVGVANSANGKRDFAALFLFTLAYVTVFIIIMDLDRSQSGLIKVSQAALSDLLQQIK